MAKAEEQPVDEQKIVSLFRMFGDPTRIKIALILARGERFVKELCDELGQTQPAVSHHLALMRVSGIIEGDRQGKHVYYSLSDTGKAVVGLMPKLSA